MDLHKKIRSHVSRAAALMVSLDAMAQNDEFVNSDTSKPKIKEDINDSPHNQLPFQHNRAFPDNILHHESSDDDDDFESDPIISFISKQKKIDVEAGSASSKDPNRFIKNLEDRTAAPANNIELITATQNSGLSPSEAQASIGLLPKFDWIKSNLLLPTQLKAQLILSRIGTPQSISYHHDEEGAMQICTKNTNLAAKDEIDSSQPLVSSSSVLGLEESLELQRLHAATRTSNGAFLLFFYLLQDKLVQHRLRFLLLIGLAVVFLYMIKGIT